MDRFTSNDGTTITYHRGGAGPALVLLHGSGGANPTAWTDALPRLEARCTVYAPDRRGYRASGDGPEYALEREVEDIAALVDAIGAPVVLLGHSFGALCALEAGLRASDIARLILYEPAFALPRTPLYPHRFLEELERLLDAGNPEGALVRLYHEIAGMSHEEIEQLRASDAWAGRVAAAGNAIREARVEERYRFDARRFAGFRTPTLLLQGSDSPPPLIAPTEALAAALPRSRIAVLPGQQHIAMYTAPALFADEVLHFALDPD